MNRKNLCITVFVITAAVLFFGCKKTEKTEEKQAGENTIIELKERKQAAKDTVVEIKDKMFIAQVNEVYVNKNDYMGKTIKLEGIFKNIEYGNNNYFYVIRYGPGCCGNDGNVGFELAWKSGKGQPYPEDNTWVEATGVLDAYKEDNYSYLYLDLISLAVLDKRGQEYVSQ